MICDRINAFASCPAATGEASRACPHFPDGAHRCGRYREHVRDGTVRGSKRITHRCTCGYLWTCLTGTLTDHAVVSWQVPL